MDFYGLTLGTLAVWRVTHLLAAEAGPGDVLARLRRSLGEGFWGRLLDCFYCLSLWVALPFALLLPPPAAGWRERLLTWLSLSAGAILLERGAARAEAPPPAAHYFEDPAGDPPREGEIRGGHDELLRKNDESGPPGSAPVPEGGAGGRAGGITGDPL